METKNLAGTRTESDLIGAREIPSSALYGVQTLRGIENFPISKYHLSDYPRFIYGLAVTKMAFDEGVFINPVIPPACAPQDTLLRFALMATHTKEQVDIAVEKLTRIFKTLEIIK